GTAWHAALSGREVAGEVDWESGEQTKVVARLAQLHIPRPVSQIEPEAPLQTAQQRLPSLDLSAEDFVFEDKALGRVAVRAEREPSGWNLKQLEIANPDSKLSLTGKWFLEKSARTEVDVQLDISDLGKFFGRLGWPDTVRGGKATVKGPLRWSGGLMRLDVPTLSGKIRLEAKNGRFRQIEPGIAKLLGILSLQALPRRISLDFKDVFNKGYSFDSVAADVDFFLGAATTDNFLMQGPAARVAMRGQVGLASETQNLNIRVTPSVSDTVSVAGAIINPVVGIAALIAQKALNDPLGQLATFEYSVTGTWSVPIVEQVKQAAAGPPAGGR
ncbi:MAG: YhdP family protein, partial [Burkholderiales bacterium]